MRDNGACLLLSVPVCSFRKGYAREYFETEEVPPPSTIYGFLLSLVGEENRRQYEGVRIAYAMLQRPACSVVIRTTWRIKEKSPPGVGANRRPDYQEILTGLRMGVWVEPSELAQRVRMAGDKPHEVERYGGLSLGESRDLVNDIEWFPSWQNEQVLWLVSDPEGGLSLPVWVDHVGSEGTVWKQFRLELGSAQALLIDDPRWIRITATVSKSLAN